MNMGSLKPLRPSFWITGLLAAAIGISGCQQDPEPELSSEDNIGAAASVPMSAEPAEPNDNVIVIEENALEESTLEEDSLNDVQDEDAAVPQ